jgi:predicted NUDIX family NTP pyrophosphohydrolase
VISAGLLLYRRVNGTVEVLLAHPGGPFWLRRDEGAWSIPKGEAVAGEELLEVARREFEEEVGIPISASHPRRLGTVTLRSGKVVHAWACEGDADPAEHRSNLFSMEWPPRSGRIQEFPEIDRIDWFTPEVARQKLNPAQGPLIDRLVDLLEDHK